jgi:4'-phosphopantetheinyl transferase
VANLDEVPDFLPEFRSWLSPAELEKAGRLHRPVDRHRSMAARGLLRWLLGRYLGLGPERLGLASGASGKPCLAEEWSSSHLDFNLSHSGPFALFAFARDRRTGADIEQVRPDIITPELVAQVFSPRERKGYDTLPESKKVLVFFTGWTRKEAYLKATGGGLSGSPTDIEITLAPDEPAAILREGSTMIPADQWTVLPLTGIPQCAGTIVVEGLAVTCPGWQWFPGLAEEDRH